MIILGFPHCGTSILKSIFGHIDDVEKLRERARIVINQQQKNI